MAFNSGITEERDVKLMPARAGAAVSPYRILQAGTDGDEVIHATNQNNPLLGVSGNASENGKATYEEDDPIKMKYAGVVYVEMSGTGSRGARVTAGAAGVGVAHTTLPGSYILGIATQDWTDGQIIPVEITKFYIGTYAT